ncbi:diacylglycerol kinase [Orrella marina]|nr:diacylglycerol kinase [Orrella marina]
MAATGYSWKGLKAAVRHEAAFRQELGLVIVLIPFAFLLARSPVDLLMLIGSLFLVLVVELINSAIEALADAISLEHHTLLGRSKDFGSAAVFLSVLFATLVWVTLILTNLFSRS